MTVEEAIQEIVGTNYGEAQCHRETMVLAIEALREKAEREKGCEACGLIYKLDGAAYGTVDELVDNTFCPMCGKRLEVHHEAD